MVTVAPSTSFEAVADFGVTGLAGTIGVRIIDNAGATTVARATAGIAEYPATSGIYTKTLTSPGTAGQYTLLWDDGSVAPGHTATEDLLVSRSAPAALTAGPNYLTVAELKGTLALTGQVFADDDLELAISAASGAVNEAASRRFYSVDETRYFTPPYGGSLWGGTMTAIRTGDLVAVSELKVDNDGNGSYETTWTEGTHFTLEPLANSYVNRPYDRIQLFGYPYSLYRFPFAARSVKVTGTFGWAATPPQVKAFTSIIAAKLVARMREREARLGIASVGVEADVAIRLARTDPDYEFYLGPFVNTGPLIS